MIGRFIRKPLLDAPWVVAGAGVLVLVAVLLAFAVPAGAGDAGWGALRRPLHLPKLASGAACPVSRVDARVPWDRINIFGGTGIGRGPVYPGLGSRSGLLYATRDEQYGGRWFGEKVFWYVLPSYRGPVLIRGRRLDGPQSVGFNGAKRRPLNAENVKKFPRRFTKSLPRRTVGGSRDVLRRC
jgi:hypothetical protein